MYAIIESCGKQYKVAEGDVVFFEKLDAEEGKKVSFDKVVLVSDDKDVKIGTPYVKGAKVEGTVIAVLLPTVAPVIVASHDATVYLYITPPTVAVDALNPTKAVAVKTTNTNSCAYFLQCIISLPLKFIIESSLILSPFNSCTNY